VKAERAAKDSGALHCSGSERGCIRKHNFPTSGHASVPILTPTISSCTCASVRWPNGWCIRSWLSKSKCPCSLDVDLRNRGCWCAGVRLVGQPPAQLYSGALVYETRPESRKWGSGCIGCEKLCSPDTWIAQNKPLGHKGKRVSCRPRSLWSVGPD